MRKGTRTIYIYIIERLWNNDYNNKFVYHYIQTYSNSLECQYIVHMKFEQIWYSVLSFLSNQTEYELVILFITSYMNILDIYC